jgi:hypothetical protein
MLAEIVLTISLPPPKSDHQCSFHNFWSCILDNQRAMEPPQVPLEVSAAVMGKNDMNDIAPFF